MSNERLRAAMTQAGVSAEQLAELVEVDPKSIGRWVAGRVPHPRRRARVARILGVPAHELWPETESPPPPPTAADDEGGPVTDFDAIHLGHQDPDLPEPTELITAARTRIDLLDPTLTDLLTDDETRGLLAAKADAGVAIRVLVADPDSIQLIAAAHEQGGWSEPVEPPQLSLDAQRSIGYLQPLLESARVEARAFVAIATNAILRVDDRMLVALHLHGAPSGLHPVLELSRRHQYHLFDRFAHHYDLIWQHAATPLTPDPDRYPDPGQDPKRYEYDPDRSVPRYGSLGPVPQARPTQATEPTRRRRLRRS